MAETPGKESQADTSKDEEQPDEPPVAPSRRFGRLASLFVTASVVVGAAAFFALSNFNALPNFNIALPNFSSLNFSSLAELFPRETASAPMPDPIIVALKDIQSAQQQSATALYENGAVLQQSAAALKQDAANLEVLRQSSTAQQADLKRISSQLSQLAARVDSLQNAVRPLTTSSISPPNVRGRADGISRKKNSRLVKPVGPVSVRGAPLGPVPPLGWGSG